MNSREDLLWRLSGSQLAQFDTHLYLDTHPNDCNALAMYHKYVKGSNAIAKEYTEKYGPLVAEESNNMSWDWISDPWPWESEAR